MMFMTVFGRGRCRLAAAELAFVPHGPCPVAVAHPGIVVQVPQALFHARRGRRPGWPAPAPRPARRQSPPKGLQLSGGPRLAYWLVRAIVSGFPSIDSVFSPRKTIATAQSLYHRFHLFFPRKDFNYHASSRSHNSLVD